MATPSKKRRTARVTKQGLGFVSRFRNNAIIIIDGLRPDDLQNGKALYDELRDLKLAGHEFHCERISVKSRDEFLLALDTVRDGVDAGLLPVIHFEVHGDSEGFEVGPDRHRIEWSELVPRLREINVRSNFNVGVVMAACGGLYAIKPITIHEPTPFHFLLGPQVNVGAGDLREAIKAFYTGLVKTHNITVAMDNVPAEYKQFLAEKFAAIAYGKHLKRNGSWAGRDRWAERLASSNSSTTSNRAERRRNRKRAMEFTLPSKQRFNDFIRTFLPRGCGFEFEDLLEFVRRGRR